MTAPHFIIAASREYAEKQARMIEAGDIPALYMSRQEADRALANYPMGSGVTYRVYEVERTSRIGEAAAMVTLVLLAIAAWIALPGEAFAASIHQPASAADHWSLWIAGLIFLAAAVMGVGAFLANLFRNDARDYFGEHYDGND